VTRSRDALGEQVGVGVGHRLQLGVKRVVVEQDPLAHGPGDPGRCVRHMQDPR
jgi:hypothetical protein